MSLQLAGQNIWGRVVHLAKLMYETGLEFAEDRVTTQAAAIAFYTLFSLAPLAVIAVAVAGFFFGEANAKDALVQNVTTTMGAPAAEIVDSLVDNLNQPSTSLIATGISLAVIAFGATAVFAQLQDSLNTIWHVKQRPGQTIIGWLRIRFTSFCVVLGIGALLIVYLVGRASISAANEWAEYHGIHADPLQAVSKDTASFVWQVLEFGGLWFFATLLFAMLFKVLPDVRIWWRDVWIGAGVSALFFAIGVFLIGFYLRLSSIGSVYGAAGSLAIMLVWIYYCSLIFLFGGEFTQVYARNSGRHIRPASNALLLRKNLYEVNPESGEETLVKDTSTSNNKIA